MPVRVRSNGQSLDDFVREAAILRSKANDLAEVEPAYYKPDSNNGYPPDDIILNGLVLNLPLYKLTGGTFKSIDPYHTTFTNTGTIWTPQARTFDGIDDQITGNNTALDFTTSAFTLEVWAKFTILATAPYIINKTTGTETVGYEMYVQANGSLTLGTCQTTPAQQYSYTAAGRITTGAWFHCMATRSGATGLTYVDGVDRTATFGVHVNPSDPSAQLLRLGYLGAGTPNFILTGSIGEARIYNRALSAVEVAHNYNVTRWRYK